VETSGVDSPEGVQAAIAIGKKLATPPTPTQLKKSRRFIGFSLEEIKNIPIIDCLTKSTHPLPRSRRVLAIAISGDRNIVILALFINSDVPLSRFGRGVGGEGLLID
jgi:hypothetical protein